MTTGTTVVTVNDIPATANKGGGGTRSNKYAAAREKKKWEGLFFTLCLANRLPKGLTRVTVNVELQFTDPGRRRDVENFRQPVIKPLADALQKGGWLPDDTAEFFQVGRFDISAEKIKLADFTPLVKRGMVLTFEWERDE